MAEHEPVAGQPVPENPERRTFLARVIGALFALIAGLVGLPILGYLLAPLVVGQRQEWIDLGPVNAYEIGETNLVSFKDISPLPWAGLTAATAIYVRRTAIQEFIIFAVNCTHLGCPVNWLSTAELFLCPCHGGVFDRDGTNIVGPPRRPLFEYNWRVERDHLFVQTRPLPPAEPGIFARRSRLLA